MGHPDADGQDDGNPSCDRGPSSKGASSGSAPSGLGPRSANQPCRRPWEHPGDPCTNFTECMDRAEVDRRPTARPPLRGRLHLPGARAEHGHPAGHDHERQLARCRQSTPPCAITAVPAMGTHDASSVLAAGETDAMAAVRLSDVPLAGAWSTPAARSTCGTPSRPESWHAIWCHGNRDRSGHVLIAGRNWLTGLGFRRTRVECKPSLMRPEWVHADHRMLLAPC